MSSMLRTAKHQAEIQEDSFLLKQPFLSVVYWIQRLGDGSVMAGVA